jgi:regulator of sirC expression with transglutaminase-like and TPR domain
VFVVDALALPSSLLSLLRFERLARLPERRMGVAEGALLIAEIAYPDLPHARYHRQLDALAAAVRAELGAAFGTEAPSRGERLGERATAERAIGALRDVLVLREGLRGNAEDYYDPSNSYLCDVLQTRRGLPITLSVVYLEVARRIGLPLVGVGLPMHFVVKWPLSREQGGDLFVDVFAGAKVWSYEECRTQVMTRMRASAGVLGFDPRWTRPVGTRAILTRMLSNLKTIYLSRGETQLALEAVERLLILRPDAHEELRDRGLLRLALGEPLLAAADIAAYAQRAPEAPEVGRLRRRVLLAREMRAKLN